MYYIKRKQNIVLCGRTISRHMSSHGITFIITPLPQSVSLSFAATMIRRRQAGNQGNSRSTVIAKETCFSNYTNGYKISYPRRTRKPTKTGRPTNAPRSPHPASWLYSKVTHQPPCTDCFCSFSNVSYFSVIIILSVPLHVPEQALVSMDRPQQCVTNRRRFVPAKRQR